MIRFLSVCSGIEAASVALEPIGWQACGFAEIDKAASRVLAHHFPDVTNHGDFTKIDCSKIPSPCHWLIGGTPCQSFSLAGKRLSLADARGNLTLAYVALAHELAGSHGLKGFLWENVPGVLSADDNAFGCFLGALSGHDAAIPPPRGRAWPGAGMVSGPRCRLAWRVLDAQYFGLAQRRRRVFVVGSFDKGIDPAAVLFERAGVCWHPPSRSAQGQGIAGTLSARAEGGGGLGTDFETGGGLQPVAFGGNNQSGPIEVATACNSHGGPAGRQDFETETFIAEPFAFKPSHFTRGKDGAPDGLSPPLSADADKGDQDAVICAPIAFTSKDSGQDAGEDISPTLRAMGHEKSHANSGGQVAIAFDARQQDVCISGEIAAPLDTDAFSQAVAFDMRGREGGAQLEGPHDTANLRAASGGASRSFVAAVSPTLRAGGNDTGGHRPPGTDVDTIESLVASRWAVRRLLPVECERLQGFPDGYTAVGNQADGPRYKQIGNSMAVPVIRWLGKRMAAAMEEK